MLLKFLWRKWVRLAQAIGNFQAQVILALFYAVVVAPLGFFYRLFADPLNLHGGSEVQSNFQKWQHTKQGLEEARKQY